MKKYFNLIKKFSLQIYSQYIKTFDPLLLSYFPFIGWFIPMIIRKDDEFYMYHAKQGFVLAVFFTGSCTFLYLLIYFVSVHADILKFIIVMLIYILYIIYFAIFIMGTRMIKNREKKDLPYISPYIHKYTSMLNI
jgi:hypothetical protein